MRVTEPYTIFQRALSSGKKVYYYQYRDSNGHRSTPKSTGCTTLAAARRFCNKLYNEGKFTDTDVMTFGKFAAGFLDEGSEFLRWKSANGKPIKPETLRRYKVSLKLHLLPYFGEIALNKITSDTCKQWVIWASAQWSPKSVNNDQGVLNLILETAVDKELINKNPLHRIGLRKVEKKQRILLSIDELKILYQSKWPLEQERTAFLLAAITGMRIGEILALHKDDIKKGFLSVTKDVSERYGLQDSTKTGIKRCVPYPSGFIFPESQSEWLFTDRHGDPMKAHCVYNAFSRRCDAMGIDRKARGIDIHSLRDFFVTHLRSQNVPDPKIRAVVGHTDSSMTDVYTHWKPDMFPEIYKVQESLYIQITGGER